VDEAEEAGGSFVVAGGEAAGVLQPVEAALDPVAESVSIVIDRFLLQAMAPAWDGGSSAGRRNAVPDRIGVIALVGHQHLGGRQIGVAQGVVSRIVRDLARRQFGLHRQAVTIGPEVDFGREATF
jgi:hypothetical protein